MKADNSLIQYIKILIKEQIRKSYLDKDDEIRFNVQQSNRLVGDLDKRSGIGSQSKYKNLEKTNTSKILELLLYTNNGKFSFYGYCFYTFDGQTLSILSSQNSKETLELNLTTPSDKINRNKPYLVYNSNMSNTFLGLDKKKIGEIESFTLKSKDVIYAE